MTTDTQHDDLETTGALHEQWADSDSDAYVNDLAGAAEQAGSYADEPADTMALACAGAIAGEALGLALDHPWALYTPQDAAVVASALRAQADALATNLRLLAQAVEQLAERGEVTIPTPSGLVCPGEENLADALDRLRGTADHIEEALETMTFATAELNRAPARFQRCETAHHTLRAVASLLGDGTTILGDHPEDDHDGMWCGCSIEFLHNSEAYNLSYGDPGWSLIRESDGTVHPDGSKTWQNSITLSVTSELAHPVQIVEEVKRHISDSD